MKRNGVRNSSLSTKALGEPRTGVPCKMADADDTRMRTGVVTGVSVALREASKKPLEGEGASGLSSAEEKCASKNLP